MTYALCFPERKYGEGDGGVPVCNDRVDCIVCLCVAAEEEGEDRTCQQRRYKGYTVYRVTHSKLFCSAYIVVVI